MYDPDTLPTEDEINKADKPLNKPFRLPKGSSKKFGVYVKDSARLRKLPSVILTWKSVGTTLRLGLTSGLDTHVTQQQIRLAPDTGLAACGRKEPLWDK